MVKARALILIKIVVLFLAFVGIACLSYFHGGAVTIEKQSDIYGSLLTVSSVIFAIMGAWLALIYPNELDKVYKGGSKAKSENIGNLFVPVIISSLIIVFVVFYLYLVPAIKEIPLLLQYREKLRSTSYFFLGILCFFRSFLSCMLCCLPVTLWVMSGQPSKDQILIGI